MAYCGNGGVYVHNRGEKVSTMECDLRVKKISAIEDEKSGRYGQVILEGKKGAIKVNLTLKIEDEAHGPLKVLDDLGIVSVDSTLAMNLIQKQQTLRL